jgi:hypothetical protein
MASLKKKNKDDIAFMASTSSLALTRSPAAGYFELPTSCGLGAVTTFPALSEGIVTMYDK